MLRAHLFPYPRQWLWRTGIVQWEMKNPCAGIVVVVVLSYVTCVGAQESGKLSTENAQKMFTSLQSVQIVMVEVNLCVPCVWELVCRTTKAFSGGPRDANCWTRCTMESSYRIHSTTLRGNSGSPNLGALG
ncbi:hypothetical protein QJS04_geneDACA017480 [Acorus gramineus]|uniref:Uncharacterized protein n=1 Tax=Acorus gramineus TaxID=55184 RepID=A0AAV9AFG2_ACOGR|nr:hypothetical protein QJS04_geneDACA017480 [Acorus gramineus]